MQFFVVHKERHASRPQFSMFSMLWTPSTSFCKRLMARNMATKNSCMKHFKMTTSFRQHDSKINCPRTFCTRKAILLHIKIVKRHPSKSPAVTGKSKTSSECHQPFVHCHLDHLS